jgi:serine/threonine protein kinase
MGLALLDSQGDRVEAYDQAMYRHNRLQEEISWEQSGPTKAPPKTQLDILKHYKGKMIPYDELKLRKVIGSGCCARVYFAKWQETVVAVKKLQNEKISESRIKDFSVEVLKFCKLDHPNIVKFIGACIEKPNLCIVMEYMQMTLYDALHVKDDTINFSEAEQIDIINQTSAGLEYLHTKRIAHCDLKTPNILMDYVQNVICEVKITDFGLSMIIHDTTVWVEELVRNIGTPQYSPPEMLRGEVLSAKDMMKADVYSLAFVLLEVIFKDEPFPDYTHQQLKNEVGIAGNVPEVPSFPDIDESIKDIMNQAWSFEPRKRPTVSQICETVRNCQTIYKD